MQRKNRQPMRGTAGNERGGAKVEKEPVGNERYGGGWRDQRCKAAGLVRTSRKHPKDVETRVSGCVKFAQT